MVRRFKQAVIRTTDSILERLLRRHKRELIDEIRSESRHLYRQVASYLDLRATLGYDNPIPPLRGWPISPDLAVHLIHSLEQYQPKRILEVGSGFSTVLLARYCRNSGATMISLDHEASYASETRRLVEAWGLANYVDIVHSPIVMHLVNGDTVPYFSEDEIRQAPGGYDFVFIDGPPEHLGDTVRGGLLPILGDLMVPGCRIIMDDYQRKGEREVVQQWQVAGLAKLVLVDSNLEKQAAHLEVTK